MQNSCSSASQRTNLGHCIRLLLRRVLRSLLAGYSTSWCKRANMVWFVMQDACNGYQYGMECLFRFYSYGLEKDFDVQLYKDFESTTLQVPTACCTPLSCYTAASSSQAPSSLSHLCLHRLSCNGGCVACPIRFLLTQIMCVRGHFQDRFSFRWAVLMTMMMVDRITRALRLVCMDWRNSGLSTITRASLQAAACPWTPSCVR